LRKSWIRFRRVPHSSRYCICSRVLVAGLKDRPVTQGMENTLPLAAVENIGQ